MPLPRPGSLSLWAPTTPQRTGRCFRACAADFVSAVQAKCRTQAASSNLIPNPATVDTSKDGQVCPAPRIACRLRPSAGSGCHLWCCLMRHSCLSKWAQSPGFTCSSMGPPSCWAQPVNSIPAPIVVAWAILCDASSCLQIAVVLEYMDGGSLGDVLGKVNISLANVLHASA